MAIAIVQYYVQEIVSTNNGERYLICQWLTINVDIGEYKDPTSVEILKTDLSDLSSSD